MKNSMKRLFILSQIALLAPCVAVGQQLGAIKVVSHLNQSLNARISVTPAQKEQLDSAHIGLASDADFERAGIKPRPVLDAIRFKLVKDADGKQFIELTTQTPIKEPLLNFIVEVMLPDNRLLREYSIFLDPPVTPRTPLPRAVVMNHHTTPAQKSSATPPSPVIATRSIDPQLTRSGYGPTMRPNTLWDIAKAMYPHTSASTQQVMLAIVKGNPEAFYDKNVNALKAGYFLHTPGKNMINQISAADAEKEVTLQYQRWRQSRHEQNRQKSAPLQGSSL
jgi:pilus assembly protein FimV